MREATYELGGRTGADESSAQTATEFNKSKQAGSQAARDINRLQRLKRRDECSGEWELEMRASEQIQVGMKAWG